MPIQEISRSEWPSFFDSFSRRYEGWLVTIEVFGPDIGDQTEERELSLAGISAELGNGGKDRIEIMLGATSLTLS